MKIELSANDAWLLRKAIEREVKVNRSLAKDEKQRLNELRVELENISREMCPVTIVDGPCPEESDASAYEALKRMFGRGECGCHKCRDARETPEEHLMRIMVLCPECGNKRCPKASDHENACTNSNEAGQKGSVFE